MESRTSVPLCLPSNFRWNQRNAAIEVQENEPRGNITVCPEGLKLLQSIQEDNVVVVCITGPARTGKSYFLSQIEEGASFKVSHTTTAETTGIWISVAPTLLTVNGKVARLVLLDAEGLGSTSTVDQDGSTEKWDMKVFTLCALFSSYLIYNSRNVPTVDDLDKLGFLAQFRSFIYGHSAPTTVEGSPEDIQVDIAPYFMWLIRDTLLQPQMDGKDCSWEKYITSSVLSVNDDGVKNRRNAIKKAICTTFRHFDAYGLPPPSGKLEVVRNLSLPEYRAEINPEFLKGIQDVKEKVLSLSQVKKILGCYPTGDQLATYVSECVKSVNKGLDKLSVPNTLDSLIELRLNDSFHQATQKYDKCIQKLKLPVLTRVAKRFHHDASKEAQEELFQLLSPTFDDDTRAIWSEKLTTALEKKYDNLKEKNLSESRKQCENVAAELTKTYLTAKTDTLKKNCFKDVVKAKEAILREYSSKAKGPLVNEVKAKLKERIQHRINDVSSAIIQASLKTVDEMYARGENKVKREMPFEEHILEAKYKQIVTSCSNLFIRKCEGCYQFHEKLSCLKKDLRDRFDTLQNHNDTCSQDECEKTMKALKMKDFDTILNMAKDASYSHLIDAKEKVITKYDQAAVGPAKDKVKRNYMEKIDEQLSRAQGIISLAAFEEAEKELKEYLDLLEKRDPLETDKETSQYETKCTNIRKTYEGRCCGIDTTVASVYETKLSKLEGTNKTKFVTLQKRRSEDFCRKLMEKLIREHLTPLLDEVHFLADFTKVKEHMLKLYNEQAKGPSSEDIQKEYVVKIDRDIDRGQQQRVLKGCKIGADALLVLAKTAAQFGGNPAKVATVSADLVKLAKDAMNK